MMLDEDCGCEGAPMSELEGNGTDAELVGNGTFEELDCFAVELDDFVDELVAEFLAEELVTVLSVVEEMGDSMEELLSSYAIGFWFGSTAVPATDGSSEQAASAAKAKTATLAQAKLCRWNFCECFKICLSIFVLLYAMGQREELQIHSVNLVNVRVFVRDGDHLAQAIVHYFYDSLVGILRNAHRDAREVPFGSRKVK